MSSGERQAQRGKEPVGAVGPTPLACEGNDTRAPKPPRIPFLGKAIGTGLFVTLRTRGRRAFGPDARGA